MPPPRPLQRLNSWARRARAGGGVSRFEESSFMGLGFLRTLVCRRPGWVVVCWFVLTAAVGWRAPDLSRLAAEGQARLLGQGAESRRAAEVVRRAWPDQSFESLAVVVLHRPGGLTAADRVYARRLAERFVAPDPPPEVLRVMGPGSAPEVAARLVSRDATLEVVGVPLGTSFVGPSTH